MNRFFVSNLEVEEKTVQRARGLICMGRRVLLRKQTLGLHHIHTSRTRSYHPRCRRRRRRRRRRCCCRRRCRVIERWSVGPWELLHNVSPYNGSLVALATLLHSFTGPLSLPMPAPNLLALVALVALVALSSGPLHVNALVADRAQVARHVHAHDAIAKRKRSDSSAPSSSGRCKPRPSSSLVSSPLPTSTPTPTSTTPPPAPSTTSAAPSPTSTGATKKGGLAWGADDSFLPNFASLSQVSL